jgi:aminopeptidase N
LYVEYFSDHEKAISYMMAQRMSIRNNAPIVADKGVASSGKFRSTDKYYKGSWMLQSLRYMVNDDERWFDLLRAFNADFYHSITNTEEVISYFDSHTQQELAPVMRQYLLHASAPLLQIKNDEDGVKLRWQVAEPGFAMPVEYQVEGSGKTYHIAQVGPQWKKLEGVDKLSIFDINRRTTYFIVREVKE